MGNEFRVKNGIITPKIISEESDGRVVLTQTSATSDNEPIILAFESPEVDIHLNDVLGKITFAAPDEGAGTDALLVAAGIQATSEGDFSATSNATSLEFMTGASEVATAKWKITSAGVFAPTSTNTFDLGIAAAGTINDIHFSSGGQLEFNGNDILITHSSNYLTLTGGSFKATSLEYGSGTLKSEKEVSSTGTGVLVGANARFSHTEKDEAIQQHNADVTSGDRSWGQGASDVQTSVFSVNQANAHVGFLAAEDANAASEQLYHICFINLDDYNFTMYGSVEVQGMVQVVQDDNGTEDTDIYNLAETIRATWDIAGDRVDMYSVDCHWHNTSTGYRPGEFIALKWSDGTSNWMVISYVNFVAHTNTKTSVSAHIRALERPKVIQG